MSLAKVTATRYLTPLREGGSLPGVMEADDLGTYVCKFRGAGQGVGVLVAEVIVSELARRLSLRTPQLVQLHLDKAIARYEADEEVQDLLNASLGLNLGVDFLPGSFGIDSSLEVDEETAARVLWLDALTANVDRTWRNPNLLLWHDDLWLIDHGAALYFHHAWANGITDPVRFASQPYAIADHVMERYAARTYALDADLVAMLDDDVLASCIATVPDEWLEPRPGAESPDQVRAAYLAFLIARRDAPDRVWVPGSGA